jgi:hypothetical protein
VKRNEKYSKIVTEIEPNGGKRKLMKRKNVGLCLWQNDYDNSSNRLAELGMVLVIIVGLPPLFHSTNETRKTTIERSELQPDAMGLRNGIGTA